MRVQIPLVGIARNPSYYTLSESTVHMAKRENISLAPLTPDQAMAALLRVKPSDVAKLEAREKRAKKSAGKKKRGK